MRRMVLYICVLIDMGVAPPSDAPTAGLAMGVAMGVANGGGAPQRRA